MYSISINRLKKLILPMLILIFFIGTVFFSIVYMAKDNNYDNTIYQYFKISRKLHIYFMYMPINKRTLIYFLNLSSFAFIGSNLIFALYFYDNFTYRNNFFTYIFMMAPLLIIFLFFSPVIYKYIYLNIAKNTSNVKKFRIAIKNLHNVSIFINFIYFLISWILIFKTDTSNYPIKQLKVFKWLVLISDILVCSLYYFLFYRLPAPLTWVSKIANIEQPISLELGGYSKTLYSSFTYLIMLILIAIGVTIYNYDKTLNATKKKNASFLSKVASTDVSVRTFSHYIKNEIITILADIESINKNNLPVDTTLSNIEERCYDIFNRLNELQTYSNRITLNQTIVFLDDIINNLVGIISKQIELNKIDFKVVDETSTTIVLFCDMHYIKEVLINLVNNSIESLKMSPVNEPSITLILRKNKKYNNQVEIIIRDNGVGFDDKLLKNVFEPFISTKATSKNWGIGLSFVKRIVVHHNGSVIAKNVPGGAEVSVSLPIVNFE